MTRIAPLLLVLALLASACGSTSEDPQAEASSATTTTSVVTTTTTLAPTTTTTEPPATTTTLPGATEEDVAAITLTYEVVFSSETDYEEKAPYLVDPTGLEETVVKYMESGESMGGVSLAATKITVDGDTAEVIYDFLFAGTPTYPDLTGDAVRVDGSWKITREMFCSIMTSARVGCPAE